MTSPINPPHILLLDGDPESAGRLRQLLDAGGLDHELTAVATAAAASAALREGDHDLIILDALQPGLDSLALWRVTRASCPDIPVLVFSDTLTEEAIVRVLSEDLCEFVAKRHAGRLLPLLRRLLRGIEIKSSRGILSAEARAPHRRAMEALPVSVVIADATAPDLPLVYVNPAFEEITGYRREEALGRNCRFLQGPDRDQPGLNDIRAALREGREARALLQNYRKDGAPFWNQLAITPVRDDGGTLTHFIGIMEDVTQRKQDESVLERYEFMVNAVGEMMCVVDRDHRYEAVNDQWCVVVRRRRDALIGMHLAEIWGDAAYTEMIAPCVDQCFKNGYPVSANVSLELTNGGPRACTAAFYPYHATSGEVAHVVLVIRDVTEQMRAKAALQASEARLRSVLESVADGIVVIDERGNIETFNPAAERIFGHVAEAVLGRNVSVLMSPSMRDAHDGYLRHYLETGQSRIIGVGREVTGQRKDGATFPMDLAVSPMHVGDQRYFTGIIRDITERKRNEREMMRALKAAESASLAKSEFLSSMSHELRTPMNAILGFAQLLEMDPGLAAEQADNAREILGAARHLLGLINEVLELSRIESGHMALSMESLDLKQLVEECATLLASAAAQHGIEVQKPTAACPDRWVWADRLRLKQVLINLLSNAIKYNQAGGRVRIECETTLPHRVRLRVIDTGPGIALERQGKLFTPFDRLGRETGPIEGSGIGLVITRRLVEMMYGEIGFDSQPGQGSTFWVELAESAPMREPAPRDKPSAVADVQDTPGTPARKTLLYIENNAANLRLMRQFLASRRDLHLIGCADALQGLALARSEQPDLILLDINLPGMSGYDILKKLRADADTRATPVLAVSADAMPTAIERELGVGFQAYLTKPLDLDHLLAEIDRALLGATPARER